MSRIAESIQINTPRERIFAYAADVSRQPQWITFIKEIQVTSGDGRSVGTTDRCLGKVGPYSQVVDAVWTEYRPNEVFGRRLTSGLTMQGRLTFTPRNGGTQVRWTIEYRPPMGLLGMVLDTLFMRRIFRKAVADSLRNLKAALEDGNR